MKTDSNRIIEGNVIELAQVSGAVAIAVADKNDSSPYVHFITNGHKSTRMDPRNTRKPEFLFRVLWRVSRTTSC